MQVLSLFSPVVLSNAALAIARMAEVFNTTGGCFVNPVVLPVE
jgi:hypothetical protein